MKVFSNIAELKVHPGHWELPITQFCTLPPSRVRGIISFNWIHFTGHSSKYQFKLVKIRKGGGASLGDRILWTNTEATANIKRINELTRRGWSKWPWVNTPAASIRLSVQVLQRRRREEAFYSSIGTMLFNFF